MKGDKVRGLASHDTTVVDRMNDDDDGRRISIWRNTNYYVILQLWIHYYHLVGSMQRNKSIYMVTPLTTQSEKRPLPIKTPTATR